MYHPSHSQLEVHKKPAILALTYTDLIGMHYKMKTHIRHSSAVALLAFEGENTY